MEDLYQVTQNIPIIWYLLLSRLSSQGAKIAPFWDQKQGEKEACGPENLRHSLGRLVARLWQRTTGLAESGDDSSREQRIQCKAEHRIKE